MKSVVRVVALAIVALTVGGAALALTSRNALDDRLARIEADWREVRPTLEIRYEALATANDAVRSGGGSARAVVGELDAALAEWDRTIRASDLRAQLRAANQLEGLGRRLVATAADSPRLASDASTLALAAYSERTISTKPLNSDISAYADERGGAIRSAVADLLDHPELPQLDL
jgi:hypothetical protein